MSNTVVRRSRQKRSVLYRRVLAALCILFGVLALFLPSNLIMGVGILLIILGLLLLPDYWWFRKYIRNENPYTDETEEQAEFCSSVLVFERLKY